MSRRWFLASVTLGAAADAASLKDARPLFTPAAKITRTVDGGPAETFPDPPSPSLQLLGPGDALGFDRSVVVRSEPPDGATDAVPEYFAHVEFSDASLPWLLSLPAASRLPWLTLLVLRDDEGDLAPGTLTHVVTAPGSALPDLAESWAWAHVEARVEDGEAPQDAVARDVRSGVDDVVARLVCPRRLDPERDWLACVVPTTKAGRAAGLGEAPPPDGAAAAWTPGQSQITLPVYHAWRFRTGKEGSSFEDLARRIEPVRTDRLKGLGFGSRTVDVRHPWPHEDLLKGIAPDEVTVPVHGALTLPGTDTADEEWTHRPSMDKFRELVTDHLDAPASRRLPDHVGSPPDRDEKAVAAPLYGSHHSGVQTVPPGGWMRQLNTQVKYRIAAAIGARYVQLEQEFLMARAWEQIGQADEANQALAAGELAAAAAEAAQAKHLGTMKTAALTELATLYRDGMEQPDGAGPVQAVLDPSAVPRGAASTAFVRLTRPGGALRRRTGRTTAELDAGGAMPTAAFLGEAMDASKTSLPVTWLAGVRPEALPAATGTVQGPLTRQTVFGDPAAAFSTRTLGHLIFTMWMVCVDFIERSEGPLAMFPEFGNPRDRLKAISDQATHAAVDRSPRETPRTVLVRGARRLIGADESSALLADTGLGMTGGELVGRIRRRVRPMPRTMDHMTTLLGGAVMSGRTADDPRPLRPLMRHPEFGFPIAAELLARWPEWAVPGITNFPDDSSALLEPNPAFVEALLVGLNQEFNRELRWREYPTDEAGTPFSRFWPPGGAAPGYGEIARWRSDDKLGDHDPSADSKLLVLLIRAEVLRRYPGTIVLTAKSVNRTVEGAGVTWQEPRFVLPVDERTNLYGFEGLTVAQAAAEHWMFVVREPMRAAQFGFDKRTDASPPFASWPDLTWDEVPQVNGFVVPRVVGGLPPTIAAPLDPPRWEGLDAADFARILFQRPFQVAFSAKTMLTG
ncbi:hypothetical protein [Streptomyces naphthomycinicus]|uniref:hypothetical protein n=1 Tax=Streptomyces naphthomycinicus TaxID=2872625 RepID=UPI001CEC00C2|nr:hypothetical protein [Streptomyces sp. TML10]